MRSRKTWRMSGLMMLMYAVQGAWWPLLASHLSDCGIGGAGRGLIFATMAIASVAMPLGAGRLVDRLMPTQHYLAWAFALGSILLGVVGSRLATGAPALFGLFLAYFLLYAPCHGLANSLVMRNLDRPSEQFPGIRLWGTVGWMAVGWLVSGLMAATGGTGWGGGTTVAFWVGAGLSALACVYTLTLLPHTPPLDLGGDAPNLIGQARELLRQPDVAPYLAVAFGVNLTTPFVFQVMTTHLEAMGLQRAWVSSAMSLGQIPEIGALVLLPWALRRFGEKATLALGIAAWSVRYASMAAGPPLWLAVAGIPLHGVGNACFTIGGHVFIDSKAPPSRRAGAQALNMVVTNGLANLLGSLVAGRIVQALPPGDRRVFLVPALVDTGLLIFVLMRLRTWRNRGPYRSA
ncbi:MFS transporter [Isosphaeraceae bacterium EP7]